MKRIYTFAQMVDRLAAGVAPHPQVHAQDFDVRMLQDGVALLTYKSAHVAAAGGLERHALRASVWRRTAAGWTLCSIKARQPRPSRRKPRRRAIRRAAHDPSAAHL